MKKHFLTLLALLMLLPVLAEEPDHLEAQDDEKEDSLYLLPQEQFFQYYSDVMASFNATNYLKSVIVVIRPLLAEAELAELFLKEQPEMENRSAFLKKWTNEYRKLLTNGYGFRLTFQLKNNFIDQQEIVNVPKNIAEHFTLLSSSGVRTKAYKCVSDIKLPRDISFECPEINIDLYFNTCDESGKPLINAKTKAIRLQSSEVNSKFGSYNFSWWLPFKYTVKRPVSVQRIVGNKAFATFVANHPKVYYDNLTYLDKSGRKMTDRKIAAVKKNPAPASQKNAARKVLTEQEKSDLTRKALSAFLFFGLLAP